MKSLERRYMKARDRAEGLIFDRNRVMSHSMQEEKQNIGSDIARLVYLVIRN